MNNALDCLPWFNSSDEGSVFLPFYTNLLWLKELTCAAFCLPQKILLLLWFYKSLLHKTLNVSQRQIAEGCGAEYDCLFYKWDFPLQKVYNGCILINSEFPDTFYVFSLFVLFYFSYFPKICFKQFLKRFLKLFKVRNFSINCPQRY